MNQTGGKWNDLNTRLITGVVLAVAGIGAVWAGGFWFAGLVILATGAMVWEMTFIARADDGPLPIMFAIFAAVGVMINSQVFQTGVILMILLIGVVFGFAARRLKPYASVYVGAILLAATILINLHASAGAIWILWLVLVVIASDVAGYLAGRMIGGPKFWPKISPKKTWSGTVAGWLCAAIVGAIMAPKLGVGTELIIVSAVLALAGQLGDIAESALKRQAGIKDSSNLLPGHGGVLDRMDALIGASIGLMLVMAVNGMLG